MTNAVKKEQFQKQNLILTMLYNEVSYRLVVFFLPHLVCQITKSILCFLRLATDPIRHRGSKVTIILFSAMHFSFHVTMITIFILAVHKPTFHDCLINCFWLVTLLRFHYWRLANHIIYFKVLLNDPRPTIKTLYETICSTSPQSIFTL